MVDGSDFDVSADLDFCVGAKHHGSPFPTGETTRLCGLGSDGASVMLGVRGGGGGGVSKL